MGINERKEREKEELRQKIVEAAKELFVTEGYEKTSLRSIAEKIEYSPATIYLHFKDKVDLLHNVCISGFDKLFDSFEGTQIEPDPLKRLRLMGHRYFDFALHNPEMYDLMFILHEPMLALTSEDEWKEGFRTFYFLRDTIADGIALGQIRPGSPDQMALMLWSLVHGFASLYIRNRFKMLPPEEREPAIRQCIDLAINTVIAPGA